MILDTNALSALAENDSELIEILENEEIHHLPSIVLGEFYFGLISSKKRSKIEHFLGLLEDNSIILDITQETSRIYAGIRYELKLKGTPIPENDIWIAALSRQHRLPVVSRDRHFDYVDKMHRVSW